MLEKQLDNISVASPRRPMHRTRVLVAERIWPVGKIRSGNQTQQHSLYAETNTLWNGLFRRKVLHSSTAAAMTQKTVETTAVTSSILPRLIVSNVELIAMLSRRANSVRHKQLQITPKSHKAPSSSNLLTISTCPPQHAHIRGLQCSRSGLFTSPPFAM